MVNGSPADKISLPALRPALQFALNEINNFIDIHNKGIPKVLEVGCGIRSVIGTTLRKNSRSIILHGLDIDKYAMDNKEVDEVFISSVENMPLADGSYDIVIALFLLEHVHDYKAALREMTRVIAENGILVLIFPNPAAPEAIVTRMTPLWIHTAFRAFVQKIKNAGQHTFPTTFSFKSCRNVRNHLMENGCREVDVHYFAETYYRFRYWRILGNITLFYAKLLSALGIDFIKSTTVVVGHK